MPTGSDEGVNAGLEEPRPAATASTRGGAENGTDQAGPSDAASERRQLRAVWLAAGSASAAMVAVGWYIVARNGGQPPAGDMIGHAATAEWLRTLPWWDWRGWSDWFYGGQAVGVNYPPLGHAIMRFTHPVHSQMAAVAVGLLVLLPWGTLRLARAVGYPARAQRAAVGAVLVLVPAAGTLHFILAGFQMNGFFGSWQAMNATVGALFCAAWAARGERPVACGAVAGVLVLLNASVTPGAAVVCLALLATSGLPWRRALHWAAVAGPAALAVCAWWLVPFVAGRGRFVNWDAPLGAALDSSGITGVALLAAVAMAATWAARRGPGPARRLALAAAAGLATVLIAELAGLPRAQRWLRVAILVAAAAAAGGRVRIGPLRPPGRLWAALGATLAIAFAVVTRRYEVLPLAVWLLWWPRRTWVAAGAFAWASLLIFAPLAAQVRNPRIPGLAEDPPLLEATTATTENTAGLVYLDRVFEYPTGEAAYCGWSHPWRATVASDGRIRPLWGLYRETSRAAEFVVAEQALRIGEFARAAVNRPHWYRAWLDSGARSLDRPETARLLGAGWYGACDPVGSITAERIAGVDAAGVTVSTHPTERTWHEAAVRWWVPIATATAEDGAAVAGVPILSGHEARGHPPGQAATGVSLHRDGDALTVEAASAGWVWIRVPWDPDWRSLGGTPVRLGGPGHLVVWADRGTTELRWGVPRAVDVAAVATTGAATLVTAAAALAWRRRDPDAAPHRDAGFAATEPATAPPGA